MTYSFYFHNDVTVFHWSKDSHCIDHTNQGDNFENAENESLWKEQLDSEIPCKDQRKGQTVGPFIKVYENRDVESADVNSYQRVKLADQIKSGTILIL